MKRKVLYNNIITLCNFVTAQRISAIKSLLIQLIVLSSCLQNKTDEQEQIKTVLMGYFDGIKTKDFQKMRDLTTDDFVLYENGKVFNNDSLFKIINNFPKYTAGYKLEKLKINVDNNSGNIIYYNHGDFVFNDTTKVKFDWLESATFKKLDRKWKMDFLHSTVRK